MDTLAKLQYDVQSVITKGRANFKKSPKERLTQGYIESRLEYLEEQWKSFVDTHRTMLTEVEVPAYTSSSYCKGGVYEITQELYCDYKAELKDNLLKITRSQTRVTDGSSKAVNSDSSLPVSCNGNFNVKLPKIAIPTFSGKYTEWTTFKDLFVSLVHNNTNLPNVHKLHYLKAHLSGEAEQLLRHIPVSESNYIESWSLLEKRYSNKKFLSNCFLKRLVGQSSITVESSSAIKSLLDTTTDCLNGLKNLGLCTDSWDAIVIFIISSKLDAESRKLWEARISTSDDLPSMNQFKEFLEHRFRSLEFLPKAFKPNLIRPSNNITSTRVHHATEVLCVFCSESHKLCNCKKFAKESVSTRRSFIQSNNLCFNCMGPNHSVFTCRQTSRCRVCKKKHHSLLHNSVPNTTENNVADSSVAQSTIVAATTSTLKSSNALEEANNVVAYHCNSNSQVLLATALVRVQDKLGSHCTLRSLIDQGSQASFITEAAVQSLGLQKLPAKTTISGVGDHSDSVISKSAVCFKIRSVHDHNFVVVVRAHVLNKLTSILPTQKVTLKTYPQLVGIQLADPDFHIPNKVDLLLGADIFGQILVEGIIKGPPGTPVAQNTKLGWILSGRISLNPGSDLQSPHVHTVISMHTTVDEDEFLKKFWELEAEPHGTVGKKILTQEEEDCEKLYAETTARDSSGRYVVKLPFRSSDPQCKYGNSQVIAAKRLQYLEKRLDKNSELKQQYSHVLNEYIQLNHMEEVPENEKFTAHTVYLPHHAVVRKDKTTSQVRVVFNASSPGLNGVSLNNDLMVGPTLQLDLRHIIMRWRRHPIALTADIIKMYRQVKVTKEDADFQRILWSDGVDTRHYRLLRLTFGTASAPYLAVRTLRQLAYDEGDKFPEAAKRVLEDYFMDDLMSGCQTKEEGLEIYKHMNALIEKGGFKLQKWNSNNRDLIDETQGVVRKSIDTFSIGLDKDGNEVKKVLGLTWNNTTDEFEYAVQLPEVTIPVTKRKVISDISRLYDPLGWIAPSIIQAKIFIQKLWMAGLEWDQELPDRLLQEWLTYKEKLTSLTKFTIPRWMHTSKEDVCVELHGFCDASTDAYAAVVYLRVIDSSSNVYVNLVTSKTKVSPIKQVSIPRLELCGAVLLAKLLSEVAEVLEVSRDHVHAWTDSQVVLAWLSSHPSRWKTFVANRVAEILTLFDRKQWSHVRSAENPADCASRGIQPSKVDEIQLWKNGPSWLLDRAIKYSPLSSKLDTTLEVKSEKETVCAVTEITTEAEFYTRFSSFRRLVRVLTYCRRFIKTALAKVKCVPLSLPEWLTNSELQDTVQIIIKQYQHLFFKDEINCLSSNDTIKSKSQLRSLNPYLDKTGVLRVGGRLQKAQLNANVAHPILIPYKSHLTDLLLFDAHERTLHGGPQLTLNYLRSAYWVINARRAVKSFIHKCVVCTRYSSRTSNQLMGQLPSVRVTPSRPFQHSGVDYAGPISIRTSKGRGHRSTKGYICIFICMSTKAIHLEAVSDLTSEGFLAAFKRFVARRGHCSGLWSDNGTNFVGAARELKSLLDNEKSYCNIEIANWLSTNGTEWHFIPPHAPNFGGLWEAGVKSTKHHLRRVVGTSTLTFEEITTVLAQIEACLNSRPITQVSDDSSDPYPLTPGHFLVGGPLLLVPDANYESTNISSLRRWQYTQKMVQDFWRRWSKEYLAQFLQRHKWSNQVVEPRIGDIVLVKEDDLPPARWLYGIVTQKHPGSDQITRVVSLRCKNSVIKRPVSKLCVLPIDR